MGKKPQVKTYVQDLTRGINALLSEQQEEIIVFRDRLYSLSIGNR